MMIASIAAAAAAAAAVTGVLLGQLIHLHDGASSFYIIHMSIADQT